MRLKTSIVFLGMLFSQFSVAAEDVKVLATIKPLQLLAADIVGDTGQVELLVKPGASPHHYSMKPSDRRKLDDAHVIAWVGPDLETFLTKTMRNTDALVLQMAEAEDGHEDHDQHKGHDEHEGHDDHKEHEHAKHEEEHDHDDHEHAKHEEHDHDDNEHAKHEEHDHDKHEAHEHAKHEDEHHEEDADAHGHEHHHHDHDTDPHLWLDPIVTLEFGKQLKEQLASRYPAHADTFARNYERLEKNILDLDGQLKERFKPVQSAGFFVFHDAWGHFVTHYGLNQLGYFTVDPGRTPGARHLTEIREKLEHDKAVCVFSEPQFKPSIIKAVTRGLSVRQGEIDPLATDEKLTQDNYTGYIRSVADKLIACLAAG